MLTPSELVAQRLRPLLRGRVPGQVVIQCTDLCNARCPQCGMRVTERFECSRLPAEDIRAILEQAARLGVSAVSFTGGEPFLLGDDLFALLDHAGRLGLDYLRTGTNGYMFMGSEKPDFLDRVKRLAARLAETRLRNFWISLDSADPAVHEAQRGLPGVVQGIAKALPVFHSFGLFPTANLGLNRNVGGDWRLDPAQRPDRPLDEGAFRESFTASFQRFYRLAADLGFTIVNCCYPMSLEGDPGQAVYAATSQDAVVRFSPREKTLLFRSLLEVIPAFRSRLRVFSPRSSLLALIRQHEAAARGESGTHYPCRGGLDFFFIDSRDGQAYPCGYRGTESLGRFQDFDPARLPGRASCDRCDWECFRDPSELFGPLLDLRAKVIPAQDQLLRRQTLFTGDRLDLIVKISRLHAGVAAELVDLVGGGLDQQHGAMGQRHVHGGA